MIKEAIEKVMHKFPVYEVKQVFPFAGSALAEFIRHDLPEMFSREFDESQTLVGGSICEMSGNELNRILPVVVRFTQ